MRVRFPILFTFLLTVISAKSQYYYKDILLTRQNQDNWKSYTHRKYGRWIFKAWMPTMSRPRDSAVRKPFPAITVP